jgi:hypothetical protein
MRSRPHGYGERFPRQRPCHCQPGPYGVTPQPGSYQTPRRAWRIRETPNSWKTAINTTKFSVRRIVKFLVEEGFPIDTVEAFKALTHLEYYHHSLTNNEKSAVSIISDKLLETYSSEDLDMLYLLHHAHPPPRYLSME